MNPIPYGRQHITQEDLQAVMEALQSDLLTQGPLVATFENQFAEYIGVKYAVAVSNGTTALHLAALTLGLKPGQKVITTPITFAASANCIRYCGAEVVFADIDPETALIDYESVSRLLEAAPKNTYAGIIPVDFAGYPVDMEKFQQLAKKHDLWLIEDACHAPGGYFIDSHGRQQFCGNGNYAEIGIFSFHPVKHIACGEGGMITTNSKVLYEQLILLRTHGITKNPELLKDNHGGWYYDMIDLGFNYRLTDISCALGLSQLKRAETGMQRRKEIAAIYDAAFENTLIKTILPKEEGHAYHLYVIQIDDRKGLYDYLKTKNIHTQVHYIPVHTMSYYQNLGHKKGDFPNAENYYEHCLSLPMYPTLTNEEQLYVINQIKYYYENLSNYSSKGRKQAYSKKKFEAFFGQTYSRLFDRSSHKI